MVERLASSSTLPWVKYCGTLVGLRGRCEAVANRLHHMQGLIQTHTHVGGFPPQPRLLTEAQSTVSSLYYGSA